ncbi:ABC-three component system protein [Pectobacterium sp. IFB5596]|uniref:ABC-three component system protein n=1 Tax=Pectobacterium sp. IFB5596 TaxID=1839803 RepID=UPI001F2A1E2E|nr:ABC-three component system protein [Pectobacterium sp. IFB5596]MCE9732325.1 hypothetical protein [Pectobacterium sp. IFB5596]
MNEEESVDYPASAISTWSGYVYQGKIALYHSLKLIDEGEIDFELQLDSTDDFAIYKEGKVISAHQVKAKIGKYRKSYTEALEKSAKIEFDRVAGISRYFHVSVELDDSTDYINSEGEVVKFYPYGTKMYCGLGEIEALTKELIKNLCASNAIVLSEDLLHYNYCMLSENISSQAVAIHRIIQEDRKKANEAAYENRISAKSIVNDILSKNPHDDTEYFSVELKARLYSYLEERLDQFLPGMSDSVYTRARNLFDHIRTTNAEELRSLCQLMKPSERFSRIQRGDIRRYSSLIEAISIEPILNKLPHYLDDLKKFYIPTALDLPYVEDHEDCTADIIREMKSNDDLLKLLFEYNNLIASRANKSFIIDTKFTNSADLSEQETQEKIDSNIVKTLCISIVTKEEAEARLK